MFAYLNEVEELISDQTIGQLKKMKNISERRQMDHFENYEAITKEMFALGDQAVQELNAMAELGINKKLAQEAAAK